MWSQSRYIKQSKWKPHLNCLKKLLFEKSFRFNFSKISENVAGMNFRERLENYDFAGINFRKRPENYDFAGIFANDRKISEIAKVSTRETFQL